jgi:hypothetical protein
VKRSRIHGRDGLSERERAATSALRGVVWLAVIALVLWVLLK